jgi:hypothetical protein
MGEALDVSSYFTNCKARERILNFFKTLQQQLSALKEPTANDRAVGVSLQN